MYDDPLQRHIHNQEKAACQHTATHLPWYRRLKPPDGRTALAVLGTLFVLLYWFFGACYTIDGILLLTLPVQTLFGVQFGPPLVYLLLLPIPMLFSLAEWTWLPFKQREASAEAQTVWIAVWSFDLATTFSGIKQDIPSTPWWLVTAVGLLLTLSPEFFMIRMLHFARGEEESLQQKGTTACNL
jgi:hypothetical protein